MIEGRDNCGCEVAGQNRDSGHGYERPDYKETPSSARLGREVTVADRKKSNPTEINGLPVGHVCRGFFGLPKGHGADTPENGEYG